MTKAVSCKLDGERLDCLESMAERDGWDRSRVIRESLDVTREIGFDTEAADVDERLEQRVSELERELAEKETKIGHLEEHLDDLRDTRDELAELIAKEQQEAHAFEELAEIVENRDADVEGALQSFDQRLQAHDQNLAEVTKTLERRSTGILKLNNLSEDVAENAKSLREEVERIRREVSRIERKREDDSVLLRDALFGDGTLREWLRECESGCSSALLFGLWSCT